MQSLSLWTQVVPEFAARDPSRGKIVSRAAQRLVARGYVVPSIDPQAAAVEQFAWGAHSTGQAISQRWTIHFHSENHAGKVLFHGELTIVQEERLFVSHHADDVAPAPTCRHAFVPDRSETAKRLDLPDPDAEWENGSGSAPGRRSKKLAREIARKGQAKQKRRSSRSRDWQAAVDYFDRNPQR